LPVARQALAVAGWMRYVAGVDERGAAIDVRDPLANEIAARVAEAGAERLVAGLLGLRAVFGPDLPADPRFVAALEAAMARLRAVGARRAAAESAG
jgi:fructuronate reductase